MIFTLTLHAALDRTLRVPGFAAAGGTGLLRAELLALVAAGKGFNVSRNLAELGVGSVAAGLVGRRDAAFYEESFRALGIETLLGLLDAPTRCNVTVLDPDSGRELHLREAGPEAPRAALAGLLERLAARLAPGDTLAACGSLPRGVPAVELQGLLAAARSRGARTLLDSSGAALEFRTDAAPEVLKVNAAELSEMTGLPAGSRDEAVAAARSALGRGVKLVLVTLGADGALAVTAGEAWAARARPVRAVNTVGAGDAFTAGFLAGGARGLPEALRLAIGCGAAQAASAHVGGLKRAAAEELARLAEVVTI